MSETEENIQTSAAAGGEEFFDRFPRSYVKQHMLLVITFTTLLVTGLPLLAPKFILFRWIFSIDGVFLVRTALHRIAAIVFIAAGIYHIIFLITNRGARKDFMLMLPRPKDATDALGSVMYNVGLSKKHPKMGRFSFIEKFEYLAVLWGSFVMVITGIILWLCDKFLGVFPKIVFDISMLVHAFEAILAGLTIVIWHMYIAHLHADFFPMNRAWLDGKISKDNIKKHHYLEYEEIMKQRGEPVDEEHE